MGEKLMILVAVLSLKQPWVIGRRRHHAKNLARGWLYGYDGAYLALHHALAKGLEINVEAKGELLAWHGTMIELAVLVMSLHPSMGVAEKDLHSLDAAELFLIVSLHAQLAYVVARLVIAVLVDVALRYLRHLAKDMGSIRIHVLPYGSLLDIEAGETKHLLTKHAEVLVVNLRHEQLLGETGISWILGGILYVVHPFDERLLGNAQGLAEVQRVKVAALLVHHDHDVVGRLIENQQLTVPVAYDATTGELHLLQESVGVGALAIVVAHDLKREQPDYIEHHYEDCDATYNPFPILKTEILHLDSSPLCLR